MWGIDPFLGKDFETNNETTAGAIQQSGKHAYATIVTPMLGKCSSWTTTMETGVFYVVRVEEL
jgi:hypothetical protein